MAKVFLCLAMALVTWRWLLMQISKEIIVLRNDLAKSMIFNYAIAIIVAEPMEPRYHIALCNL